MADRIPTRHFHVDPNEEMTVKLTVHDPRDLGNIQCSLGTESVTPSLADLEAVAVKGGRHVLRDPETGKCVFDPAGALGPDANTEEGLVAQDTYDKAKAAGLVD